jgi:hypothetical protein
VKTLLTSVTDGSDADPVKTGVSSFLLFLFSASIGVLFGYVPARRAVRFDPIEALRQNKLVFECATDSLRQCGKLLNDACHRSTINKAVLALVNRHHHDDQGIIFNTVNQTNALFF